MKFSKEQKDYIIHALEHCEVLTGGRHSGKTLELIKQQEQEIERLNNIINELEKYFFGQLQMYGGGGTAQEYYDKLQELKGSE